MAINEKASYYSHYLPQGALWESAAIKDLFIGLACELARLKDTADNLFKETFPLQSVAHLELHEADYGLPHKCAFVHKTNNQNRKAILLTHIRAKGGQRAEDYINLARNLGYEGAEIIEHRPFTCGQSACGNSNGEVCGSPDIRHHFSVKLPQTKVSWFRCGVSALGQDPLGDVETADDYLCALAQTSPTQTNHAVIYNKGDS